MRKPAAFLVLLTLTGGTLPQVPAAADWQPTVPDYRRLGYHWVTCLPEEPADPDAELVGDTITCLGLGCRSREVVLTGLGLWIADHATNARLHFAGRELTVRFEPDEATLRPLGRLQMRAAISAADLDAMMSADKIEASTDEVGPIAFSLKGYAPALAQSRTVCRRG